MTKVLEENAQRLRSLLIRSLTKLTDRKQFALLFSGGLDSSVIAALLAETKKASFTTLVVGIDTARDITTAKAAAKLLKLPLSIRIITKAEVKTKLTEILTVLRCVDVLQVSLAIPLFFAASYAKDLGLALLVNGQGADELFGGYARHEKFYVNSGSSAVTKEMQVDLEKMQKETFPLQQAVAQLHGLQIATPFLDVQVIDFAKTLPIRYKIHTLEEGIIRKRLLRCLAKQLGLPLQITEAPKRAIQYGSGTQRLLEDLSIQYWSQQQPNLSHREARSNDRIHQFLLAQIDE